MKLIVTTEIGLADICKPIPTNKVLAGMNKENLDLFQKTVYFVAATYIEILWLQEQPGAAGFPKESLAIHTVPIAKLLDIEVFIRLAYYKIKKKVVCFYDMPGTHAIWPFAESFLKEAAPNVKRLHSVDSASSVIGGL